MALNSTAQPCSIIWLDKRGHVEWMTSRSNSVSCPWRRSSSLVVFLATVTLLRAVRLDSQPIRIQAEPWRRQQMQWRSGDLCAWCKVVDGCVNGVKLLLPLHSLLSRLSSRGISLAVRRARERHLLACCEFWRSLVSQLKQPIWIRETLLSLAEERCRRS